MRHLFSFLASGCILWMGLAGISSPMQCQETSRQSADIVRGQVRDQAQRPMAGVQVSARDSAGGAERKAITDKDGRYTVLFRGSGTYVIHVIAIGKQPATVVVRRQGTETAFTADVIMQAAAPTSRLDTLQIQKSPNRPQRQLPDRRESHQTTPGTLRTDVGATLLPTNPGVVLTPDGYSVLGADPSGNTVMINGMTINGLMRLPAGMTAVMNTATYDPAAGGFSGGQISISTYDSYRSIAPWHQLNVLLDAPALQSNGGAVSRLGQKYTAFSASLVSGGSLGAEFRTSYYGAINLYRNTQDLYSLNAGKHLDARILGLASDSVQRLAQFLSQENVPATLSNGPSSNARNGFSGMLTTQWLTESGKSVDVFGMMQYNTVSALQASPAAFSTTFGHWSNSTAMLQVSYNSVVKNVFLYNVKAQVSTSHSATKPYLALPAGVVRITSQLPDETMGTSAVGFGGNGNLANRETQWQSQINGEVAWLSLDNAHRISLIGDLTFSRNASRATSGMLGTYTYNSLADVYANTPARFTRTLDPRVASGKQWTAWMALRDEWRPKERLNIVYGIRVDGTRLPTVPAYNARLDSILHVRNTTVPNSVAISPRIGFTWTRRTEPGKRWMSWNGGIGLYTALPSSSLVTQAAAATGLPGGPRYLSCVGPAVPSPTWDLFGNDLSQIPSQCADGTGGSIFADSTPSVQVIDPRYRAPKRWGATFQAASEFKRLSYSVTGMASVNTHQPSSIDLNFADTQRFILTNEGGRPVFVEPGSIVPATGALSYRDSRRAEPFSSVTMHRSDARSTAMALHVNLYKKYNSRDALNAFTLSPSLQYTAMYGKEYRNGFSGTTSGNPLQWERYTSSGGLQHNLTYALSLRMKNGAIDVTAFGSSRSGMAFTPMIAGDINGDGRANDRAFLANPATATDSAYRADMPALLGTLPAAMRRCLTTQWDRIAKPLSCPAPWQHTLDLNIWLRNRALGLPPRLMVTASVTNVLGAVDQLLHGSNNMRGWGTNAAPNPILLIPTGFDATASQFRYQVNPQFGDTRLARSMAGSPFRVTLRFTLSLSVPVRESMGHNVQRAVRQMHGQSSQQITTQTLAVLAAAIPCTHVIGQIMRTDSLELTRSQLDSLKALDTRFQSAWTAMLAPLVKQFTASPAPSREQTGKYVREALDTVTTYFIEQILPAMTATLTPAQIDRLPASLLYDLQSPQRYYRRDW